MKGSVTVEAAPPPNQPPNVSISSPADGATFNAPATVTVQANASDPDGSIGRVEFFANSNLVGTAIRSPYAVTLNNLAAGNYALTAKATDNAGASSTSSTINIIVSAPNVRPTVKITAPGDGASFMAPANVTVTADAADPDGTVTAVEFLLNGSSVGTVTSPPFATTLNNLSAGSYALAAKATDNRGATTTSAVVNFTVTQSNANVPPTISIVTPTNGVLIAAPATVILEATAADADGSIVEVAFFRAVNHGGPAGSLEPLGTATNSPFRVTLSDLQPGFYHLVAQATDNQGAKTLSSEVVLTVYAPFKIEMIVRDQAQTMIFINDTIAPGVVTLSTQASIDLQSWVDLPGTFSADSGGFVEFKDATGLNWRFYRVLARFQEVEPVNVLSAP